MNYNPGGVYEFHHEPSLVHKIQRRPKNQTGHKAKHIPSTLSHPMARVCSVRNTPCAAQVTHRNLNATAPTARTEKKTRLLICNGLSTVGHGQLRMEHSHPKLVDTSHRHKHSPIQTQDTPPPPPFWHMAYPNIRNTRPRASENIQERQTPLSVAVIPRRSSGISPVRRQNLIRNLNSTVISQPICQTTTEPILRIKKPSKTKNISRRPMPEWGECPRNPF